MKKGFFCLCLLLTLTGCEKMSSPAPASPPPPINKSAQPAETPPVEPVMAPAPEPVPEVISLDTLERVNPADVSAKDLFRVKLNGNWGFVDRKGRLVIDPQFEEAADFSEGLAAVAVGKDKNQRFGYINKFGTFVFKPNSFSVSSFSEGLAVTGNGVIDHSGKVVINHRAVTNHFSEGLAQFQGRGSKIGFVNKKGEIVIKAQFDEAGNFHEGLAWVLLNNKIGYIDQTGKLVIPLRFAPGDPIDEDGFGGDFEKGVAAVDLNFEKGISGYIDRTGKLIPNYQPPAERKQPLEWKLDESGKYGFVNRSGKWIVKPQFDEVEAYFRRKLSWVAKDGKYGFIDEKGALVIPLVFEAAGDSIERRRW